MTVRTTLAIGIVLALAFVPVAAAADSHFGVEVEAAPQGCGEFDFTATIAGGTPNFDLLWSFGDEEYLAEEGVGTTTPSTMHTYALAGEYTWELMVTDSAPGDPNVAIDSGVLTIGPSVTLTSDPFPPLVTLEGGEAAVDFEALVEGGEGELSYTWNFDGGDDVLSDSNTETFIYAEAGKYTATVSVTDECGLTATDTLPVVIVDPDEEACHPMAQRIADAVSSLFDLQANDLYTCEDIFGFFQGDLTGSQLGFGRMWHAYMLTQTIQDMTWEEILAWQLDGNGWGGLLQLNRFADLLGEYSIGDLVELVTTGEASIRELRHSIRAVTRYEADFEDALARLGDGMSPGELGRFYRTVQDLEIDPGALDEYLNSGLSLQELTHAAKMAEGSGDDWVEIAEAHANGSSWGEIKQAQRMAEDGDWTSILEDGIKETREQSREEDRSEREQERDNRTANQLASRYGVSPEEVLELYNGDCAQDWKCVREALRNPVESSGLSDRDLRTAAKLSIQYGVDESQVWALFDGSCAGDWGCVRSQLRGEAGRGGGRKPKD